MTDITDAEIVETEEKKDRRAGDGGLFLTIIDDTPECEVALRHAARRAKTARGYVGILCNIDGNDFLPWLGLENLMNHEMRSHAEKFIWSMGKKVYELNGMIPVFFLTQGNLIDQVVETINENDNIRGLILGGNSEGGRQSHLVNYFSSKGIGRLRIPLIIVPSHLEENDVDALSL